MSDNSFPEFELPLDLLDSIHHCCELLEQSWRAGSPHSIEHYLESAEGPDCTVLFSELLRVEVEQRCRAGEVPSREEYLRRFPNQEISIRLIFSELANSFPQLSSDWIELEHYLPLELLGRGGMGVVFKAQHTGTGEIVAVKVMRPDRDGARDFALRFQREAEITQQLSHPNIAQMIGSGGHRGHHYHLLEYCAGGNLSDRLNDGPLSPRDAAELIETIATALQVAHDKGIVHRDLKPANVLLTHDGRPKLSDFGLACQVEMTTRLTVSGTALGTPQYMAPEQVTGQLHEINHQTDVYGLGVILYECLTGATPFNSPPPLLYQMILTTRPEDPRRHDPTLPKELVTICLKCLEKIPRDRYACAKDLAADLKLWMSDEAIRGRPVSLWKRTWRWGRNHPFGMAALITLGVTTAGMALMTNLWGVAQQQRENAISERDRLAAVSYAQQLSIAQVCGQEQRYGEMFDILEQCPVDLRGWEWNYLTDQCRLKRRLTGHTQVVTQVATSPDQRWVASASYDGTVRLWPWGHSQATRILKGHTGFVRAVMFFPDSRHFISAGDDQTAIVWHIDHDQPQRVLRGHTGGIHEIAISRDGRFIATGAADHTVHVWNANNGEPISKSADLEDRVYAVAFGPDASQIVAGGAFNRLQVLNPLTGEIMATWPGPTGSVDSITFNQSGKVFYTSDRGFKLRQWSGSNGHVLQSVSAHHADINTICLLPDDDRIASGGDDSVLRIWNTRDLTEVATYQGHRGHINCVVSSSDGRSLVTASDDNTIAIWKTETMNHDLGQSDDSSVRDLSLSAEGRYLATAHADGKVRLREASTGKLEQVLDAHEGICSGVCFNPVRRQIASVGADCCLRTYQIDTAKSERTFRWDLPSAADLARDGADPTRRTQAGLNEVVLSLSPVIFSPDGTDLICGCWDGAVRFQRGDGDFTQFDSGHRGAVSSIAISPDGTLLATGGVDGAIVIRDWPSRHVRKIHQAHQDYVYSLAFRPDGRQIVSASADFTLGIWPIDSETEHPRLTGHTDNITAAVYSPDGTRIASCGWDGTVRIWDVKLGRELLRLRTKSKRPHDVTFTPDGRWIFCAGDGGRIERWDGQLSRTIEAIP